MIFLSWLFIVFGLYMIFSGVLGLYRFPDNFSKLHAASVIECCGIPLCLIGLTLIQNEYITIVKLIFIILLIIILNPLSTHALIKLSLLYKE